jgi:peptidase E
MKIIIGYGGGGYPDIAELDKEVIRCATKRIIFIPNAANKSFDGCLDFLKQHLAKNYHASMEIVLFDIQKETPKQLLALATPGSVVYIGAGNTFKLLKLLQEGDYLKTLNDLHRRGIPFAGYSAGAILFGEEITMCGDANDVNLMDTAGLKFVPFSVVPHYDGTKKFDSPRAIIAFPNGSGYIVREQKIQFIGNPLLFKHGKETKLSAGKSYAVTDNIFD